MNGRISLVEQKRLQWAREREELARLAHAASRGTAGKLAEDVHAAMRTRMSAVLTDQAPARKRGCTSNLGSPKGVGEIPGESHLLRASLISLHDGAGIVEDCNRNDLFLRRRSPSLPPIYTKESGIRLQQFPRQFVVDQTGLRYHDPDHTELKHRNNYLPQNHIRTNRHRGSPREDLEGETSGYASDSADVPLPEVVDLLPVSKPLETAMSENGLQNLRDCNYRYGTPESSLPPSRRLSAVRGGAEVRPRWGSLWGQELVRGDPPPPSWLERGLSRMDHTSQVLVINHESASSPDSSTTGSAGSDSNKTYLRGQNVPLDEGVLQEREAKRQKALELQSAIKDQLEQQDRRRNEEKQQRLQEERAEEERIKRERDEEKQRFEEEQRRLKENEKTKLKKAEAMRQVLEAAERLAKEEKKFRRRRDNLPTDIEVDKNTVGTDVSETSDDQKTSANNVVKKDFDHIPVGGNLQLRDRDNSFGLECGNKETDAPPMKEFVKESEARDGDSAELKSNSIKVPVSTEIAIVLSGRLGNPEILNSSNLKVNLVVTPSPTKSENLLNLFDANEISLSKSSRPAAVANAGYSRCAETTDTRLLTPSKYRTTLGREFGTQTDLEDLQDTVFPSKPESTKERKESLNANRRDIEKSTNTGPTEELAIKTLSRSKGQSRSSLEARPRWNANRPGTRYRTQSEKDPHYQRRLRLRRRQIDSSDEGSRSPSPERRKPNNFKSKSRNAGRRKMKLDSYDADLSMDSLNSIVPLRVDKNGRIHVQNNKNEMKNNQLRSSETSIDEINLPVREDCSEKLDVNWCGREILSQLTNLRNGLAMKQKEWDSQRCVVSPSAEFY